MRTDLTPETTHFEKVRAESLQHLVRGKVRIYATHRESELSHRLKRFSFNAYSVCKQFLLLLISHVGDAMDDQHN